jgi:hypothetical protein
MISTSATGLFLRRLSRAALICSLSVAAMTALAPRALAQDDEDEPIETRIMKAILGINDQDSIDYRERPPLVVPPSMNLVPPEQAKVDNPAWPKDADVQERKKRKAAQRGPRKSFEEEGRPLTPAELEVGRRAGAGRVSNPRPGDPASESGRPMLPSELGQTKGILGALFDKREKEERAVFTGEAPRTSLTTPPPGYMTPSPNHPYGISPRKEAPKPYKLEERGTANY